MQLQKLRVLHAYLTNLNETFIVHAFEVAEQYYLVVERLFTLTKVLKLRSESFRQKKNNFVG